MRGGGTYRPKVSATCVVCGKPIYGGSFYRGRHPDRGPGPVHKGCQEIGERAMERRRQTGGII